MHSFITSQVPDLPLSPDTFHIYPDPSIGITEIRQIQQFLSRKPFQLTHHTIIVHDAHLLTLPAQQAFLKTLEEPPGASEIFLVTSQPYSLLPTILSRCELLTANHQSLATFTSDSKIIIENLLSAKGVGDRLVLLDSQNFTRESLLEFLNQLELYLHHQIQTNSSITINYSLLTEAKKYLKANVSLRLILTQLACGLTRTL